MFGKGGRPQRQQHPQQQQQQRRQQPKLTSRGGRKSCVQQLIMLLLLLSLSLRTIACLCTKGKVSLSFPDDSRSLLVHAAKEEMGAAVDAAAATYSFKTFSDKAKNLLPCTATWGGRGAESPLPVPIAMPKRTHDLATGLSTLEQFPSFCLPKHLDRLVCLSMKTFAETTLPKGENVCSRSESVNSWGRW